MSAFEIEKNNLVMLEYHALQNDTTASALLNTILEKYFKGLDKAQKNDFLEKMDELDITQNDIAEYLNTTQASVSRYISNIAKKNKLVTAIEKAGGEEPFFCEVLEEKFANLFLHSGLQGFQNIHDYYIGYPYIMGFVIHQAQKDDYDLVEFFGRLSNMPYFSKNNENSELDDLNKIKTPDELLKKLKAIYRDLVSMYHGQ